MWRMRRRAGGLGGGPVRPWRLGQMEWVDGGRKGVRLS
jgi:hypothetical protein